MSGLALFNAPMTNGLFVSVHISLRRVRYPLQRPHDDRARMSSRAERRGDLLARYDVKQEIATGLRFITMFFDYRGYFRRLKS